MLIVWMAYSVLVGALVYGAALAADRMTAVWGRSSRFIWIAAAVIAAVVPLIFATLPRSATPVAYTRPRKNSLLSRSKWKAVLAWLALRFVGPTQCRLAKENSLQDLGRIPALKGGLITVFPPFQQNCDANQIL